MKSCLNTLGALLFAIFAALMYVSMQLITDNRTRDIIGKEVYDAFKEYGVPKE